MKDYLRGLHRIGWEPKPSVHWLSSPTHWVLMRAAQLELSHPQGRSLRPPLPFLIPLPILEESWELYFCHRPEMAQGPRLLGAGTEVLIST